MTAVWLQLVGSLGITFFIIAPLIYAFPALFFLPCAIVIGCILLSKKTIDRYPVILGLGAGMDISMSAPGLHLLTYAGLFWLGTFMKARWYQHYPVRATLAIHAVLFALHVLAYTTIHTAIYRRISYVGDIAAGLTFIHFLIALIIASIIISVLARSRRLPHVRL